MVMESSTPASERKSLRSSAFLWPVKRKLCGLPGAVRSVAPATIWAPGGTRERSVWSGDAANSVWTERSGKKNSIARVLFPWNRFICSTSESNCSNLDLSGLHELVRTSSRQTRERQHARNHDIAPRTPEKNRAILLRLPFENRHDEHKAFERTECENF